MAKVIDYFHSTKCLHTAAINTYHSFPCLHGFLCMSFLCCLTLGKRRTPAPDYIHVSGRTPFNAHQSLLLTQYWRYLPLATTGMYPHLRVAARWWFLSVLRQPCLRSLVATQLGRGCGRYYIQVVRTMRMRRPVNKWWNHYCKWSREVGEWEKNVQSVIAAVVIGVPSA